MHKIYSFSYFSYNTRKQLLRSSEKNVHTRKSQGGVERYKCEHRKLRAAHFAARCPVQWRHSSGADCRNERVKDWERLRHIV